MSDKNLEKEKVKKAKKPRDKRLRAAYTPKRKKKSYYYYGNIVPSLTKAVIYIVSVIVISAFLGAACISLANDIFAFVKEDKEVKVFIPENADIEAVTDILYECGAIDYPFLFKLYAELRHDDGKFVSGEYTIKTNENYDALRSAFKYKYIRTTLRITIPEGYSVDEIIDLFVSKGIGTREGFIKAINETDYSEFAFVKAIDEEKAPDRFYRLEGYLYPDTYDFFSDASEGQVIYKLLDNFNNKFKDVYYKRCEELGLTVDEVITIASYIQEETYFLDEYEYVASVFFNRLNDKANYPHIESDATIAYAIQIATGERPENVTREHLTFESPYNTYIANGLTPGAISNPGYDAIVSALYPAKSSYYYFLTIETNRIEFARSYDEHLANIAALNARLNLEGN